MSALCALLRFCSTAGHCRWSRARFISITFLLPPCHISIASMAAMLGEVSCVPHAALARGREWQTGSRL